VEDEVTIRTAVAEWTGNLAQGSGQMRLESGIYEGPYDFRSRMGDGKGTNPEELRGAAHAGSLSITLVLELTKAGFPVQRLHTGASVHFEERESEWSIRRIELDAEARVPDLAAAVFEEYAERQEELPSVASLVRRRHPSARRTPLNKG
jgi:lipoyl-dependent peroxiredoxin